VLLLATALFINYVDRGLLPTAAPMLQGDLHLSASQLGVLFSAFFGTYAIVQIPIGWVADRIGADRVLAVGLVLWAAATMLVGVVSSYVTLIALRLLLGLGEGTGFPCVSKLLAERVPIESLATANGVVGFGYLFGPAVGTFLGGLLMAKFGWRTGFLCFGALSLLWLWPWSRVIAARTKTGALAAYTPTLGILLRQPALWGACLGHFSTNYTFYFMLSWLPFYLVKERGFSTTNMAQLAGAAYVVTALCAYGGGWLIDRFIRRGGSADFAHKGVMVVAQVGAVLCMLGMAVGEQPVAVAAIFAYQVLSGASSPSVFAIPQILAGSKATGRWVGIQNAVGNCSGMVAPALTGFIINATGHFTAAFALSAAVSLLGSRRLGLHAAQDRRDTLG
jgi:MFS family permease